MQLFYTTAATSPPGSGWPCSARQATSSAARNSPPVQKHPSASRPSMFPALQATACSRPSPAFYLTSRRQLCSHKSSSDATAPWNPPRGTALSETDIAECAPENTARTAHFRERGISRRDQSPLPCVQPAARSPDTSAAVPTTLCCTPPVSLAPKTLPSAICPPAIQTAGTPPFPAPAAAGSQYRPTPEAPRRSNRFS